MTPGRRLGGAVLALAVVLLASVAPAPAAPPIPPFRAPVVDAANVVPDNVEQSVNAELLDYQRRSGNQVAVAVVKTTDGASIEDYSIDLAREWGVGEEGKDNGAVLVIAYDDRKLRIEVGRGLEGELTDLEAGRIVRDRITPLLKARDVGGAVRQGTAAIRGALGDTEAAALPEPPPREPAESVPWWLFALIPFGLFGFGLFGRRRGVLRRRGFFGGFWGVPYIGGGWGGHSRSGGFGGGGFGGGGGGGFGGGGASGSW